MISCFFRKSLNKISFIRALNCKKLKNVLQIDFFWGMTVRVKINNKNNRKKSLCKNKNNYNKLKILVNKMILS